MEYHLLLLVTLGLVAFGLVMVYSASSGVAVLSDRDPLSVLAKQAVYAAIGVVAMLVCARVPYRQLRYAGPPVMFGVIVLLVLVLVPGIGAEINNARRWILIGPISIQPSEFAKAAVLIFSAAVLSGRKRPPRSLKQLFNPVGAVALLICALVVVEPDLGTAIAIAVMVCGLLLVAGTPLRLFVDHRRHVRAGGRRDDHVRAVPAAADDHLPRPAGRRLRRRLADHAGHARAGQRRPDRRRPWQRHVRRATRPRPRPT